MSDPKGNPFGVNVGCGYAKALGTTLSDAGGGFDCGPRVEWFRYNEGTALGLDTNPATIDTRGKLAPTDTAEGTYTDVARRTHFLSWSRIARGMPNGTFRAAWRTTATSSIGYGWLTSDPAARSLGGEPIDLPASEGTIATIRRRTGFGPELRLGKRTPLLLEIGYATATSTLVEGEADALPFARLGIEFYAGLRFGYGDTSSDTGGDDPHNLPDHLYGIYADDLLLLLELRWRQAEIVSPLADANTLFSNMAGEEMDLTSMDGGKTAATGSPPLSDVGLIQSGALIGAREPGKLHRFATATKPFQIIHAATEGGKVAIALGSGAAAEPGDAGWITQAIKSAHLLADMGFVTWGDADSTAVMSEQLAAGAALAGLSAAIGRTESEWTLALAQAGFEIALAAALDPNVTDEDAVTRTTYRIGPTGFLQYADTTYARGAFGVTHDLKALNGHLAIGWDLHTPFFGAGNAAARLTNSMRTEATRPPSETAPTTLFVKPALAAATNPHKRIWAKLSGGPHLAVQFHGPTTHPGAGAHATIEAGFRVGRSFAVGLGGQCQGTITDDGHELECLPNVTLVRSF